MRLKIQITEADLEGYMGDIDCEAANAAREEVMAGVRWDDEFAQQVARLMDESMKIGVRIGARLQAKYAATIPGSEVDFIFTEDTD